MTEDADRRAAMDAAVRRLQHALAAIGAAPLSQPSNPTVLDEVAAALAPLGLPVEVDQLWRLVDGDSSSLTCFPHPHATSPAFALECWREHQQQPGMTPDLLFPVGYESHAYLLVERDGPHGRGGACFTWASGGLNPFVLVATDLTAYLEVAAETLEAGHLERHERDGSVFNLFDDEAFQEALRARLRREPHPVYGAAAEIGWDPPAWPVHWLASVGPAADEQHARGATTTIAALRASAASTGSAGRVHALVREIWGFSDGTRPTIDDGTGVLDVWCPAAVTMFGPRCDGRYEFDLVTGQDLPHHAEAEATAVRLLSPEA
ncbi:hypothetical protein GCM10009844_40440 [Nocardioides koreensis]|uniref:SMI1/KNR4 family protein n=1 Tax=Nocardioides koreensis TaxID=433651 RepID=A0ABP5LUV0_9ACTN